MKTKELTEEQAPIEAAKAFFDINEWSGDHGALFHLSLKYGKRINDRLKCLERRNKTLQRLHDEIRKEIECINEIVKK